MNDFEDFVLRYSKKHKITPDEAKTHALVREVKAYYEERDKGVYDEKTNNCVFDPQETGFEET